MITVRSWGCLQVVVVGTAIAIASGCGGSSSVSGGGSNYEPPPDNGPGAISSCGIVPAAGVTEAGPAEGTWLGRLDVYAGTYLFASYPFSGAIAADGETYFQVSRGVLWAGRVLASQTGEVRTELTRYQRIEGGGIGGTVSLSQSDHLIFDQATAQMLLTGRYSGFPASCQDFALDFDDSYWRPASLESVAGVYSATEEEGYALTITVHSDGQMDGSDTHGCVLLGNVTVPDTARNHYRAFAEVSSCGALNGHFEGLLFLRDLAAPGDSLSLNLSLSNSRAAIFYVLAR